MIFPVVYFVLVATFLLFVPGGHTEKSVITLDSNDFEF